MPQSSYIVSGIVYTSKGSVANSKVIINSDIIATTNSKGQYVLDLANLVNGYTDGSTYDIEAWDEYDNEYKLDTITVTGGGQTKNLVLDTRTTSQGSPVGQLTPVILRNIGNKSINIENPLYVWNIERPLTRLVSQSAYPKYIGEASPGTPQSASKWRIKYVQSNGQIRWADGSGDFDKIWNSRTSYTYN